MEITPQPNEGMPGHQQAFVVRGHHATRIYNILAMGMSVDEVLDMAETHSHSLPKGYRQDVFGDTQDDQDMAIEGQRSFFQAFLDLPDEHPVRFAAEKDGICNSCMIGSHCDTLPASADERFISAIRSMAAQKSMQGILAEDHVEQAGAKKPTLAIELPASAAKEILSDFEFHPNTYPRVLRPMVRSAVRRDMQKK